MGVAIKRTDECIFFASFGETHFRGEGGMYVQLSITVPMDCTIKFQANLGGPKSIALQAQDAKQFKPNVILAPNWELVETIPDNSRRAGLPKFPRPE